MDWVLFADRKKLRYNKLWIVLIYPIVWLVVILIRGATDGWVPYPVLDPATGYGSVAAYSIAIAVFTVLFGLAVFALSRVRILKP
ncbi:MAG: Pr6Pr family membrane protein [Salinibacterium sp.]|nr:Pr6Pr family membrane protein [Salinibacterium sp.]